VELLIVIVILGVLMALLLPVINGALRTAREAAVSAEINQLAQALEQFKSKYGDYPPSRFLCVESGSNSAITYANLIGNTTSLLAGSPVTDSESPGTLDITVGQLAQRSMTYLRKFWPRLNTTTTLPNGVWYDFNGNGIPDPDPYVLHGHECLVFFLGGVPLYNSTSGTFGLTGFGQDPTNPFTNNIAVDPNFNNGPNPMYNGNRLPSLYEFNPGRLFPDPNSSLPVGSQMPAYYDTMNNGPPSANGLNFYAYFSAYGNNAYDPNDVNFANFAASPPDFTFSESDAHNVAPIWLQTIITFPTSGRNITPPITRSPSPNPYTTSLTSNTSHQPNAVPSGTVTYQKPQSYQIISAGADGQYGVGGQYTQASGSSSTVLPFDPNVTAVGEPPGFEVNLPKPKQDPNLRQKEHDNLTNFKNGRLQ
jgi:general secretion pathway protein G